MNDQYFHKHILIVLITVAAVCSLRGQDTPVQPEFSQISEFVYDLNGMRINAEERTVSIPAKINMQKGLIEVVLCTPAGKTHESLLVSHITAYELQTALTLLGLDPLPLRGVDDSLTPEEKANGTELFLYLQWKEKGKIRKERIENFITDNVLNRPMDYTPYIFRGLQTGDPAMLPTNAEITLIGTYFDPLALIELKSETLYDDTLYNVNEDWAFPVGTDVTLIISTISEE